MKSFPRSSSFGLPLLIGLVSLIASQKCDAAAVSASRSRESIFDGLDFKEVTAELLLERLANMDALQNPVEAAFGSEIAFSFPASEQETIFQFPKTPDGTMASCKIRCSTCSPLDDSFFAMLTLFANEPNSTTVRSSTFTQGFSGAMDARSINGPSVDGINDNAFFVFVLKDSTSEDEEFTLKCSRPEDEDSDGDNDGDGDSCWKWINNAIKSFFFFATGNDGGHRASIDPAETSRQGIVAVDYGTKLSFSLAATAFQPFSIALPRTPEGTIVSCLLDCGNRTDLGLSFAYAANYIFQNDGFDPPPFSGGGATAASCFMALAAEAPAPLLGDDETSNNNFFQVDFFTNLIDNDFTIECSNQEMA